MRPPFPLDPKDLAPFGQGILAEYQRVIHQRRVHPWLATATATATNTTNETMTIVLSGAGHPLTLALNAGDKAVQLPGSHGMLTVHPHDWALG